MGKERIRGRGGKPRTHIPNINENYRLHYRSRAQRTQEEERRSARVWRRKPNASKTGSRKLGRRHEKEREE